MKKFLNVTQMKKFLNIIISALVLFLTFVGVIYAFALSLVNFALSLVNFAFRLPIIIVGFLFLKTKNK